MTQYTENIIFKNKEDTTKNSLAPKSEQEASLMIKKTIENKGKLIPKGGGTILQLINNHHNQTISSEYFNKLVFYEADETIVRVGAGMTVKKLLTILNKNHQTLGFDPPNYKQLINSKLTSMDSTIGGIVSSGLSGPNSISLGNIKDHLLGCRLINGQGDILKLGSRVIKNVTGFDITKLMCGSWGRLGLLSEVTLKTVVIPNDISTLIIEIESSYAIKILIKLFASPSAPKSAAWLNSVASSSIISSKSPVLALRFFGSDRQNKHNIKTTISVAKSFAPKFNYNVLSSNDDNDLWLNIKNLSIYSNIDNNLFLWRVSLPISKCLGFLNSITKISVNPVIVDCAGTRIWLVTNPSDSIHRNLRSIIKKTTNSEGQAFILKRPAVNSTASYNNVDTFHSLENNVSALMKRVQHAFDPHNIFTQVG